MPDARVRPFVRLAGTGLQFDVTLQHDILRAGDQNCNGHWHETVEQVKDFLKIYFSTHLERYDLWNVLDWIQATTPGWVTSGTAVMNHLIQMGILTSTGCASFTAWFGIRLASWHHPWLVTPKIARSFWPGKLTEQTSSCDRCCGYVWKTSSWPCEAMILRCHIASCRSAGINCDFCTDNSWSLLGSIRRYRHI